jgi:hypothetical protein
LAASPTATKVAMARTPLGKPALRPVPCLQSIYTPGSLAEMVHWAR